jgi:hypothetical protein
VCRIITADNSATVLAQLAEKQEQLDEQIEALADQLRGPGAPR